MTQKRDFAQGIVAKAGAKIIIEDCTFENFYSGIVVHKGAQVELKQCLLNQCGVGIQMYSGSSVKLDGTIITNCSEQSIRYEVYDSCGKVDESEDLQIMPNCKIGSGNLEKEVLTVNHDVELF